MAAAGLSTVGNNMPPPPPRQPRPKEKVVLEEDEWTAKLEGIIQRDYFPDLPKLQNKLDWLEAVKSGDPALIRQAQLNITQRRAGIRTPAGVTPGMTPGNTSLRRLATGTPLAGMTARNDFLATPGMTPGLPQPVISGSGPAAAVHDDTPTMALDKFINKYVSEDTASFSELQERDFKRRRVAQPWLFEDKNTPLQLKGLPDTDDYGTSGQETGTLIGWKHHSKTQLYYDGSQMVALRLTDKEQSQLAQGPPRQTNIAGTRFPGSSAAAEEGDQEPSSSAQRQQPLQRGGVGERSLLATPSFTPGREESPFMTWGNIESTPLRLEAEDFPAEAPSAAVPEPGPQFRIAQPVKRETLGRDMAGRARAALQQRQQSATRNPSGGHTPLGSSLRRQCHAGGNATPLSSAGRRLASALAQGRGSGAVGRAPGGVDLADAQLRASYRSQPATPRGTVVLSRPGSSAASSSAAGRAGTPLIGAAVTESQERGSRGGAAAVGEQAANLTEGLLKI